MEYSEKLKIAEDITSEFVTKLNRLNPYDQVGPEIYTKLKDFFMLSIKQRGTEEYKKLISQAVLITGEEVTKLNRLNPYDQVGPKKYLERFFKHLNNLDNSGNNKKNPSLEEKKIINQSNENERYAVFISHAISDKRLAGLIKNLLNELRINSFIAHEDIEKGEDFKLAIVEAVERSTVLLLLCTKKIEESPWVNFEVGLGYKKILPIFFETLSDRVSYIKDKQGVIINPQNLKKDIAAILSELLKRSGLSQEKNMEKILTSGAYIELEEYIKKNFK